MPVVLSSVVYGIAYVLEKLAYILNWGGAVLEESGGDPSVSVEVIIVCRAVLYTQRPAVAFLAFGLILGLGYVSKIPGKYHPPISASEWG